MLSKKISLLFLSLFLVAALACTANANILEYSNSFNLLDGTVSTILFTIDDTQGTIANPSMHNGLNTSVGGFNAYDSEFTISLEIGGTTYSDDVFSWTDGYPLVTLNDDGSVNAIDYWVTTGSNGILYIIESTSGSPILTTVNDYSILDNNNNGVIEENEYNAFDANAIAEIIGDNPSVIIDSGTWKTKVEWPVSEIPEPATFILFGLGLFGWAWANRRRVLK